MTPANLFLFGLALAVDVLVVGLAAVAVWVVVTALRGLRR